MARRRSRRGYAKLKFFSSLHGASVKHLLFALCCVIFLAGCNKTKTPVAPDNGDPSVPYQLHFERVEAASGTTVATWREQKLHAGYFRNFFRKRVLRITADSGAFRFAFTIYPNSQKKGTYRISLDTTCNVDYYLDEDDAPSFADAGMLTIKRLTTTEVEGEFDSVYAVAQQPKFLVRNGFFKAKIEP